MLLENLEKGLFLVTTMGIVYDEKTGNILIGRRENDPNIQSLTWVFPGGKLNPDLSIEEGLKIQIKVKTNLDIKVGNIVLARIFGEKKEILVLYYMTKFSGGEIKPMDSFKELKRIKPTEVKNYFTTSIDSRLYDFLQKLEDNGF